ncbi:hypothetical protein [Mucilaginibacter celer]|uniref:Lipoprotein n=1 Tax=Mucilaginibacter celer TaxID=2305508 RepID=A0A494VUT3_9SPHI|nr:hypothetical protein [Mucilaginibacter celer]AYL95015.1 hypothetical protein HYN43_006760 [Mucilaginibacter celer]
MKAFKPYIAAFILLCAVTACKQPKPQPISNDVSKTAVAVAGKTDSVINNPGKKYGNATVAEPCVKCLLQVIQDSKSYKENTVNIAAANINYTINWVKASAPALSADSSRSANGIRIDVKKDEDGEDTRLCSYLYNNTSGTMYLLNGENKYEHEISGITPAILKKIRNACYWGVASAK